MLKSNLISDHKVWSAARKAGLRAKKLRDVVDIETRESIFSLFSPREKLFRSNLTPAEVLQLCRQYAKTGTIKKLPVKDPPPPTPALLSNVDPFDIFRMVSGPPEPDPLDVPCVSRDA